MPETWDLERVLIDWKDAHGFTLADAMTGVFVTGATGAGKTSAPGQMLARSYLKAGMGALILCAKVEEKRLWLEYAKSADREKDVVVFDASGRHRFDPLEWEAGRAQEGGGQVINTVLLLEEISTAAQRAGGGASGEGGDSAFFQNALHLFLTALVSLAITSGEKLTLPRLRELAAGAARSPEELRSEQWQKTSPTAQLLARLAEEQASEPDKERRADIAEIFAYWTGDFVTLSSRTRSIIEMMFSMTVQPFLYQPLRQLFTGGSTITPEACFDGKIIIIDLPVQDYRLAGTVAALVWKHCFQIAVTRRSGPRGSLRPVLLFADECQHWVTERDAEYQAVCRSSGGCTVYMTQQRDSIIRAIGERSTDNLLSNLQTKFFCQNTGDTNRWASELIGDRYTYATNVNFGDSAQPDPSAHIHMGGSAHSSLSRTEVKKEYISSAAFQRLRRGGPPDFQVDTVVYCGGKLFGYGDDERLPYKMLTFRQIR